MSPSSRVALAAVAVPLVVVSPATAAHAPRHHRPNLVVTALDLHPSGRAVSGTVTVRNIGNAGAPRSVTSAGSELLATPALRAGQRATLVVATTLAARATELRVCADARHRIRESREGDNCRTYTVSAAGAGATGGTGGTTGTSTPTPYGSDPFDSPISPGVHASGGPVLH